MNVYICLAAYVINLCRAGDTSVTRSSADVSPNSNVKNTSNNFVDVIKRDLKRNNDDYKEVISQSASYVNKNMIGFTVETASLAPYDNHVKQVRRANDRSYDYYDAPSNDTVSEKLIIVKNNSKSNVATKNKPRLRTLSPGLNFLPLVKNKNLSENSNSIISPIKIPPDVVHERGQTHKSNPIHNPDRGKKMDKFKQFILKNKSMFKEYMSSSQLATPTSNAYLRQITMNEINQNTFKKQKRKRTKIKALDGDNDGKLPSPELLDMAPARGGRIHKQRIEGRLCQRHVLLPEGPKYGRGGLQYLPAHAQMVRRPFERTRPPALLLPRCCNCCRKSALGCQ